MRDGLEFLVYRFDPASVLSVFIAFVVSIHRV